MAEANFERFRRMMDTMQFDTLPLFSRPHLSWNLKTNYVGRRLMYRPSSESTMDDARSMVVNGRFRPGTGQVLLTETQSAGRGRAGRSWVSPPDVNLYFTLLLFPLADPRPLAYVTPLAVKRAIEEVSAAKGTPLTADLKWPNDVQIDGRKVAGVLIETTENAEGEPVALIGVGINVNMQIADYPELDGIATSIRDEVGAKVAREETLAFFCNHFEALLEEAQSGSIEPRQAWKAALVTLGREVVASGAGEPIRGRAVDVEDDGALLIEQADGSRVLVNAGDVTLSGQPATP